MSNILKLDSFKLIVDGDACPVKTIVIELAKEFKLEVIFVNSTCHVSNNEYNYVKTIIVDNYDQAADMEIIKQTKENDIVVTNDYGLAAIVLGKKAKALSFQGKYYTNDNIDNLLLERHIAATERRRGGRTKGPAKRSKEDDIRFKEALYHLIKTVYTEGG